MDAQDLLPPVHVRVGHHDLAVEAAGTQQGGVEHVGAVGGGDQDDALVRFEPVHLDEELVEGLLALVIAPAQACAAMAAHRVDLVDEDDAGRVLLALLEHVAHPRGADTHEHLDEIGAGDGEEGDVGLAGDGAGEQRLAGAGGADEEAALGDLAAETLEFLRVLEELDDLLQLLLGLVDAGHVIEGHPPLFLGEKPRPRLAEAHGAAAARLHLAHEEDPDADQEQHREPGEEVVEDGVDVAVLGPRHHVHALVGEALDEARIVRGVGLEAPPIRELPGDGMALDHHVADMARVHVGDEVGIGDLVGDLPGGVGLEEVEQDHEEQGDDHPQRQIATEIAHLAELRVEK